MVLNAKSSASVVPTKLSDGFVPLFPESNQTPERYAGSITSAFQVPVVKVPTEVIWVVATLVHLPALIIIMLPFLFTNVSRAIPPNFPIFVFSNPVLVTSPLISNDFSNVALVT